MSSVFAKEFYRRDSNPIPYVGDKDIKTWFAIRTAQIVKIVRLMLPDVTNGLTDPEVRNLWVDKMKKKGPGGLDDWNSSKPQL